MAKKDKNKNGKSVKLSSKIWDDIHVMPGQFAESKKLNLGKLAVIIIVIILILGVFGVAVWFFNNSKNLTPVDNQNINSNQNLNSNFNSNLNTNININQNINTNTNQNTNQNINTNTNTTLPGELPLGFDQDADGLSDLEEKLYLSAFNRKDSDEDGYEDADEVVAGYSPSDAGLTLIEAGLVSSYKNTNYSYSINFPVDWFWNEINEKRNVVINTRSGSYIEIRALDNPDNLDVSSFYIKQVTGSSIGQLSAVSINNLLGVYDQKRLTYFLAGSADSNTVYSIVYRIGNRETLDYLTTFEMMVKSLIVE